MIDTDKYKGHTQGHWAITTRKGTWVVYTQHNGDVATMNDYEDAKLIAAAPKLLAEVERLRSDMAYCASLITCMVDMGDSLSLSVVREGMLDSIGMTVDEAMATTDLMGDEEE